MGKIYERRLEQPTPTISMGQAVINKLRENGDHVLLIDGPSGKQMTNKELLEKSVKLANFLQKRGIKIGDRISIASENRVDWLIPACASLYLGAIFTPYNPMYTEYEFQHILKIAKSQIIFVSRRTENLLAKVISTLSWKVELIELDDQPYTSNVCTLTNILNNEPNVDFLKYKVTDIGDSSQHPATILSSSGTTGLPKGVTLSHKNLFSIITKLPHPEYMNLKPRDTYLLVLPFYHGYAFSTLLLCIYTNCLLVLMPAFEPKLFLSLIQQHKVTHLPIVPPILTLLAKHPLVDKYNLRSLKEIICGAAPVSKDVIAEVKARIGVKYIRNGYGMTELSVVSNISAREDENDVALYENPIAGLSLPGFLSKVVDVNTQETLEANKIGEICFKGEQVMMYYWDNPEATRQIIDLNGWLHTGDVGYYDEKGRVHVVDRLKELIKYKGYQVSPSEIETILLSHPAVKDAAVTARPDERSGEVPAAFVIKQPGATIAAEELHEFVKQKLSPQKWLRGGIHFVDAIPKNPTGKILRRELQIMISKL